ncbi:MAG: hypothetical protein M3174_07420 [Actinomycetota bacterium]|nr:hypothetical protein [Actinomycetota bacterium]
MRAKWLAFAMAVVALLGAGAYVFIYLYRWEWNRAIMAGILFLAAEVALAAALVLERLRSLESKMRNQTSGADPLQALGPIRETAPPKRRHFAWLSDQDKVGVFVPVLMGAGIVISGIAWAVERLAASTARPVLERRLALRLAPLALPDGGLTGSSPVPTAVPPRSRADAFKSLVIVLTLAALLFLAIDELGDLTQNRPDARVGGSTAIELDLSVRDADLGSESDAARSLWMACRGNVSSDLTELSVRPGGTISLVVEPALGPYSMRRLAGCLEDGTVDGLSASLVD